MRPLFCAHRRQDGTSEREHHEEVRLEQIARLVDARFLRGADERHAGAVDEDVDALGAI